MLWIWQKKEWPYFEYDATKLIRFDSEFIQNSGIIIGAISHLEAENFAHLKIEILTQEALSTSSIEGEILERDSVQSSIRKHLGLKIEPKKIPPNVAGIAEIMVDVYSNFDQKLDHSTFFNWHKMLLNGRRDIATIGDYRKHEEPMQIVSANMASTKVFYEAPPSNQVVFEMQRFIDWYNEQLTNFEGISILTLAGIVHLYFEAIHPFEDGNGRIGRALVEKVISQRLKIPALNSLAKVIENDKKRYYDALQACNFDLNIDKWLFYFSEKLLESQRYTILLVGFLVEKAKFFAKFDAVLNERQRKVAIRIFDTGIEGFKGGLSAGNYRSICGTSPATATRDLEELVAIKAFFKLGELKSTRYFLNLKEN
jgi:Fic family protein